MSDVRVKKPDGSWVSLMGPQGPGTGSNWTTLSKSSDQSVINSATLISDAVLRFTMSAATKYRIKGVVFYDTTAAGDFKYGFIGPASPTLVRASRMDCAAGGTPAKRVTDVVIPGSTSLTGTAVNGGFIMFDMIFHNGVNSALFAFQFAQNTATNDTGAIVRAGSYMEFAVA